MAEAASAQGGSLYRRYVLGVLLVISVFNFVDRQLLAVLSPEIKKELLLSDTQLGILKGLAFALFYSVMGIPLAKLADSINRVSLISVSIIVWSAMTALSGAAASFLHLLLARIGVGIGEAGATPASHSLISDYFSRQERSTALAVLALGIPIGTTFGFLAGGWLTVEVGWRMAFVLIGVPGVAVGVLAKLTIREPVRGAQDRAQDLADASAAGVFDTIRGLWSIYSYRTIAISGAFASMCGYALSMWLVDFLVRVHGLRYQDILVELAIAVGLGGGLGTYFGGKISDHFGRRNVSAYLVVPAVGMVIVAPLLLLALWTASKTVIFTSLFAVFALHYSCFGPFYGTIQTLAPIRSRATATAFLFFIMALAGAGLGPFIMGVMSDAFEPAHGSAHALRLALTSIPFLSAASGIFVLLRTRRLAVDLAANQPGGTARQATREQPAAG
jgi:predicted MFS family arabinose efflux permease